jgi:hypothetical protein
MKGLYRGRPVCPDGSGCGVKVRLELPDFLYSKLSGANRESAKVCLEGADADGEFAWMVTK